MLHSRRAFVRSEHLATSVVLAFGACLVFPWAARTRENAQRKNCIGNLQRIGIAWHQYAHDYDGHLMRFATSPDGAALPAPDNPTVYWWGRWDKITLVPEAGLLFPYVKTTAVYACPAFTVADAGSQGKMGYGYNADYLSPVRYDADYRVATPLSMTLKDVQQPALTVAFADAAQFASKRSDALRASTYLSPPSDNYPNFHGRHSGRGNVLFCDGHIGIHTPIYRQGTFGFRYDATKFKRYRLGDIDQDGDLKTNEMFLLDRRKLK